MGSATRSRLEKLPIMFYLTLYLPDGGESTRQKVQKCSVERSISFPDSVHSSERICGLWREAGSFPRYRERIAASSLSSGSLYFSTVYIGL